jgi:hypothetical protein
MATAMDLISQVLQTSRVSARKDNTENIAIMNNTGELMSLSYDNKFGTLSDFHPVWRIPGKMEQLFACPGNIPPHRNGN